jgi:hypothetical protein
LPVQQRRFFPSSRRRPVLALSAAACFLAPALAHAQDDNAELAKKLSNPVSSLISVPLQLNYDCCYGPRDGNRYTLNVQPVIPVSLNQDWNLIIRTVVPIVRQGRAYPGDDTAFGLSDTTQSFFFSPKAGHDGVTWAIGPAVLWPTGNSDLGTRKWGAGPTGLLLKQQHGFTYGVLANHIWSFADAGGGDRPDVSQTFIQPFFSYTNKHATTWGVNAESSYNWKTKGWTVPVNLSVSHLYKFGGQRVSLGGGVRAYAARDGVGPEWGLRAVATFLFPE